jgi:colanic acid biosynthesis glycosyl transferase WcaI
VRIIRIWSYITPQKGNWQRILNYGTFSIFAFLGALQAGNPDVILSYSPPLPLGITAWLLRSLRGVPWILRVEDLYPDAAIAAGVLRNPQAIEFFLKLERFIYQRAVHISVISESFRENLRAKGVPDNKLSVESVWADPEIFSQLPKENRFRERHSLQGYSVVLYAGNLGYTSALEDVLEAAWFLKEHEYIRFMVVGEGVKKDDLQALAEEKQLKHVVFLPYQSRELYPEMMLAANISLVTLNPASSPYSLPSKLFGIMASARPVVAVAPQESEIARLILAAECGAVVPPGKPSQLAHTIRNLCENIDRQSKMGLNGLSYLETHYARSACIDQYEAMLIQVAG